MVSVFITKKHKSLLILDIGLEFYSKIYGQSSTGPDSKTLKRDAVFKVASITKVITSIAVLQCIERGLIGLDDPVGEVLPELKDPEIISFKDPETKTLDFIKAKNLITPRHLLTNTSGLTYDAMDPRLQAWRASRGEGLLFMQAEIPKAFGTPLIFEPGESWAYGPSLDWAGLMVRRLNGNITFEQYLIDNMWRPLGCFSPFPTFDLNKHPDYKAKLIQLDERDEEETARAFRPPLAGNII
jgi:CubicO group peptidase (beta-lactamase class C family)